AVRRKPLAVAADADLWKFNRFLPENHCQTRDSAKTLLLMVIDIVVSTYITGHPSAERLVVQEPSLRRLRPLHLYTRSVRRRAASFSRANRTSGITFG